MKIFCVIPAFNVSRELPAVLREVDSFVDEIVVVDDASTDETAVIAQEFALHFIHHPLNRGQGAALKTGTEYALDQGADIIIHFDGDGQFHATDIPNMIRPLLDNEVDVVFGSRFLDKSTAMPWFKYFIIMPLARLINRFFFNIRLTDPQSGFRAFNRRAATLLNWRQDRMAHCNEILIIAHRQPLRITEVPITVTYNEFGQRFSGGLKILRDLFLAGLNH